MTTPWWNSSEGQNDPGSPFADGSSDSVFEDAGVPRNSKRNRPRPVRSHQQQHRGSDSHQPHSRARRKGPISSPQLFSPQPPVRRAPRHQAASRAPLRLKHGSSAFRSSPRQFDRQTEEELLHLDGDIDEGSESDSSEDERSVLDPYFRWKKRAPVPKQTLDWSHRCCIIRNAYSRRRVRGREYLGWLEILDASGTKLSLSSTLSHPGWQQENSAECVVSAAPAAPLLVACPDSSLNRCCVVVFRQLVSKVDCLSWHLSADVIQFRQGSEWPCRSFDLPPARMCGTCRISETHFAVSTQVGLCVSSLNDVAFELEFEKGDFACRCPVLSIGYSESVIVGLDPGSSSGGRLVSADLNKVRWSTAWLVSEKLTFVSLVSCDHENSSSVIACGHKSFDGLPCFAYFDTRSPEVSLVPIDRTSFPGRELESPQSLCIESNALKCGFRPGMIGLWDRRFLGKPCGFLSVHQYASVDSIVPLGDGRYACSYSFDDYDFVSSTVCVFEAPDLQEGELGFPVVHCQDTVSGFSQMAFLGETFDRVQIGCPADVEERIDFVAALGGIREEGGVMVVFGSHSRLVNFFQE